MTDVPRISVLISCYSNARFVAKKLAEIQAQTWFDQCEFLFIETASPERERELFAPFCALHPNCRLLASDERQTLYEAWNLGWRAARAPFVCYSNMDDTMHPALLEELVRAMKENRWEVGTVLIAKQKESDPQLDDWSCEHLRKLKINTRPGPFTAWRKDLAERIGMFDGQFIGAGDLDFWSRVVANRLRVGLLPKILYLYTKSPGQLSKSSDHRRDHDNALLATKPYPITWHSGWRRKVRWLRALVWLASPRFCVPIAKTSARSNSGPASETSAHSSR